MASGTRGPSYDAMAPSSATRTPMPKLGRCYLPSPMFPSHVHRISRLVPPRLTINDFAELTIPSDLQPNVSSRGQGHLPSDHAFLSRQVELPSRFQASRPVSISIRSCHQERSMEKDRDGAACRVFSYISKPRSQSKRPVVEQRPASSSIGV